MPKRDIDKLFNAALVNRETKELLLSGQIEEAIRAAHKVDNVTNLYLTVEEKAGLRSLAGAEFLPEFFEKYLSLQGKKGPERG